MDLPGLSVIELRRRLIGGARFYSPTRAQTDNRIAAPLADDN